MKILVTGGAGFVGAHLCRRLLEEGHDVLALDNYSTGSRQQISNLLSHPRFRVFEQDVCTPLQVEVERIYNLACPASPVHYQRDPVQTMKTNVLGVLNMLELARQTGARILQASTSEVYGDPQCHPQPESYWGRVNPIGIRSCYDEGKRCAETLFFDYARQHRTAIKVIRIFNTYGPGMQPDDGRVVSNFILQALRGEDITVYGDGRQTRSLCFVADLVEGALAMMESPVSLCGPINLGNPHELSVETIAQTIIELCGSRSRLRYLPLPEDDPRQRQPDISQARALLGWQPQVCLQDGLRQTIDYFRQFVR